MKITILGKTREYEEGTSLFKISKEVETEYAAPVMLAMVNGKLKELRKTPKDGDVVEFVTMETENGIRTYRRGIILVFMKALYKVLGSKGLEKVRIEHTIGNGIYGELEGDVTPCADTFSLVKQEMERIVAADMPFDKRVVNTEEAQKIFREHRMFEKEKLFGYRRVSKTNIYSLGGFEDYFYGYMLILTISEERFLFNLLIFIPKDAIIMAE